MKKFLLQFNRFSIHILLLVFFLQATKANAQEPLSIGEIYDYEIGDIFQISWSASAKYGEGYMKDIEILGKYYNQNADTVFYTRYIKKTFSSSDEPWNHYSYYNDTVSYGNLDSIYNEDSFTDPDLYNGRGIIMFAEEWPWSQTYTETRYAEGLGEVKDYYNCWDSEEPAEALRQLTYYKKGEEEWGNHQIVSTQQPLQHDDFISVYPNPSSDKITFDFGNHSNKYSELKLFTIQGVFINSYQIIEEKNIINTNSFTPGLYFYSIFNSNGNIVKTDKVIIHR